MSNTILDDITLPSPPFDSISSIRYSPNNPDQLLVSAWDTTVRFYIAPESTPPELKAKFDHRAAILTCAFNVDGTKAFSGGLDASLREYVAIINIYHLLKSFFLKTRFSFREN